MPFQLRPRLTCHYCGRRSRLSKKEDRRFRCDYCLAINYFDENGEIADVPVEEAAPPQQFAQPIVRDPLADSFSAENSIFCSTCLKNQHLYTQTLSEFLPDPDHPDYDKFDAELPAFKKGLEERYPQCCAQCEPRVRAQLQKATSNARSDHIRRVLDKSRQRRIGSRWGWRSLLVSAAGLGYSLSLVVQVSWHIYGSQSQQTPLIDDLTLSQCLHERPLNVQCLSLMERFVGLSLNLGLLCVWWNPKWQHKLSNNEGKLVGLERYYLVQFSLLFLRFASWAVLQDILLDIRATTMLHACFAVAITTVAAWSNLNIIQIRLAPPINWTLDATPLVSSSQFVPPDIARPQEALQENSRAFGLNNLVSANTPSYAAWRPPTPPEDRGESMDWTPSQPLFQPQPKTVRSTAAQPSPFYGNLPAFSARGVQTHPGQLQNAPKQAIGLPPGFFDRTTGSILPPRQQNGPSEAMAQPKFFGHERQGDTGLENIFESVFSFKDRSLEASHGRNESGSRPTANEAQVHSASPQGALHLQSSSIEKVASGIAFSSILSALIIWLLEVVVKPAGSELGYWITLSSAVIPIARFAQIIATGRTLRHSFWLFILGLEAFLLIGLALKRDIFEGGLRDLWNKLAIAVVALLLPQEFVRMSTPSTEFGSEPHDAAPPSSAQSVAGAAEVSENHPGYLNINMTEETVPLLEPPSTPKAQQSSFRRDSDESIASRVTTATSSTAKRWESPSPHPERYRWEPPNEERSTRRSTGVSSGFNGLSLNDSAYGSSRGTRSKNSRTPWDLPSSSSSGINIAGPRGRRGF